MELVEDGKMRAQLFERDTNITNGDVISTSGSSGRYPQGFVIGIVEDVQQKPDGKTAYAVIQPSEDIKSVSNVCILTEFEGKGVQAGDESAGAE